MTGPEQVAAMSISGASIVLSAATIMTLRKMRRYAEQTVELYDEAARRWEALAENARKRR